MDIELIEHLKNFLSANDLDGIVINSTNEFLVEYNMLETNSRYYLTGFSGSTGDVLFTNDKIYQFVDTRYHEQVDKEVDKEYIQVVKIPMEKSFFSSLIEHIPAYYKLGLVSQKTSKRFYDSLCQKLKEKNSSVKLLNTDPIIDFKKDLIPHIKYNIFDVDINIAGRTPDEKFIMIKEFAGENDFSILVTSLEDIAYLTNKRSYDFAYSATFPAKAIITNNGVKIFCNSTLSYIGEYYEICPLNDFEQCVKSIEKKEVYIDDRKMSIFDYNLINSNNKVLQGHLNLIKTVKMPQEIEHMKECFRRSDEALKIVYEMINSDEIYSEYDYAQALETSMKANGALSLSFKPIVAAGTNSSIIHYSTPSKEKLVQDGDFLLVDYGGYYEGGIATDTTRTFVKGQPTQEQKSVYTSVLKAFLNAYTNKYGKKSSYYDIDLIARNTIAKYAPTDYEFTHSTGHGVGISVHEVPPVLSATDNSKTKIIENTTFSIEPGIYKENCGGVRLENTVYATFSEDSVQMISFSHFPFETKLVDLSMMTDAEKYYFMKWQADSCIQ